MSAAASRREVGRGERTIPGIWRLRLPLPWPGVPHCNAWAIAAGDGIVLVDCGIHEPGSLAHLERALEMVGLRLDLVRLLVCTHAHTDHYGQAASVLERAGCELWMHPAHAHQTSSLADPEAALARRAEVARSAGVPVEALERLAAARREAGSGVAGIVLPDRELRDGATVDTDLGSWQVVETPGHAPSHICLFQPERRLLISGDHLLGRISLYYDYGWTRDPAGEFIASLDRVQDLGARLCLSGHGRTFTDVDGHIAANRRLIAQRLARCEQVLRDSGPISAFDAVAGVHDEAATPATATWWLTETLCYLRHLEVTGAAQRIEGDPEHWAAAG